MITTLLLCAGLVTLTLSVGTKTYEGYKVIEVIPQLSDQVEKLKKLTQELQDEQIDFWTFHPSVGQSSHVMVPSEKVDGVETRLVKTGITFTTLHKDVQEHIDASMAAVNRRRRDVELLSYDYDNFQDFSAVIAELAQLADDCPEEWNCEAIDIGASSAGRVLRMLRIGDGEKPAFFLDSAIHAREWLTVSTLMRVADRLVRANDTDEEARHLVENYDWYILPVVNPDGYVYSWTIDRLWRKSRNNNEGSECIGTDLDRNFEFMWAGPGSSSDPCMGIYQGSSVASEPETRAVQDELQSLSGRLEAAITFHAYGQMVLHSWAFDDDDAQCYAPADSDDLTAVASHVAAAIEATHNTIWGAGTYCDLKYVASGIETDYAKSAANVEYSYYMALRGDSFSPPPEEIAPSYEEIWDGLVAMVEAIETQKLQV